MHLKCSLCCYWSPGLQEVSTRWRKLAVLVSVLSCPAPKSSETPDVPPNCAWGLIRNQLSTDVLCLDSVIYWMMKQCFSVLQPSWPLSLCRQLQIWVTSCQWMGKRIRWYISFWNLFGYFMAFDISGWLTLECGNDTKEWLQLSIVRAYAWLSTQGPLPFFWAVRLCWKPRGRARKQSLSCNVLYKESPDSKMLGCCAKPSVSMTDIRTLKQPL